MKIMLWLVGHHNMRNIKGHSTRTAENHCPNPLGELTEHLPYKKQKGPPLRSWRGGGPIKPPICSFGI